MCNIVIFVYDEFQEKRVTDLKHPPYPPDLAIIDFFSFPA